MPHSRLSQALLALVVASVMPLAVLGCPKKEEKKAATSAEPPPPPPTMSAITLTPIEEDAGPDGGEDGGDASDAAKKPAYNVNSIYQCCARLQQRAAANPMSPESANLIAMAAQCMAAARGLGNSPEEKQAKAIAAQYCR